MFWFDFSLPKAAETVTPADVPVKKRLLMQKNCTVLITKHQSPKGCQHFVLFLQVKFHYRKSRVTCCFRGHHEKSIENKRIRRHRFVPYLSGNVLTKFHEKSLNLHTLSQSFWSRRLLPPLENKIQNKT